MNSVPAWGVRENFKSSIGTYKTIVNRYIAMGTVGNTVEAGCSLVDNLTEPLLLLSWEGFIRVLP